MRRVAQCASREAANPFESVLRSIALDVPGLSVERAATMPLVRVSGSRMVTAGTQC